MGNEREYSWETGGSDDAWDRPSFEAPRSGGGDINYALGMPTPLDMTGGSNGGFVTPPPPVAPVPTATNIWDPSYRQTGMGTPESGYGPGGVQNPAYTGPGSPNYTPPSQPVRQAPSLDVASTPRQRNQQRQHQYGNDHGAFFMSLVQGRPPSPQSLHAMEAELAEYGFRIHRNARGWADKVTFPDGRTYDVIEAATANGGKRWQLLEDSGQVDSTARGLTSSLSADGHDVSPNGLNGLIVDGRRYTVRPPPTNPTWTPSYGQGQMPYTPGAIPFDDLQGFSVDEVMGQIRGPHDPALDSLMQGILDNPESLSPLMVDTLKARAADELAEISTAEEAQLGRLGWLTGNQDSNWLQSERLAGRRTRDRDLVQARRDIDIRAAETNLADRREAASLGTAFSAERRHRTALANDTALRAASANQDRLALRETINQRAAELRLDADQLMQDYVIAQMEDLTRRWGIDVQAGLDLQRMAQMDRQFAEDLSMRLAELDYRYAQMAQDDDQFGADLSYRVERDTRDREARSRTGG